MTSKCARCSLDPVEAVKVPWGALLAPPRMANCVEFERALLEIDDACDGLNRANRLSIAHSY
jgi:hypothetical protein